MTGQSSAPSKLKEAVTGVVSLQEFKDQLSTLQEGVEIKDAKVKEKVEAIKNLLEKLDVNKITPEEKTEITEAIRTAVGNDPDNKKFNWVVKQLGLEKLGLTPPTVETVSPVLATVEQASEAGEEEESESSQSPATPLTYEQALEQVPVAQRENIKKLLNINRGGETSDINVIITRVLERVGRDLEGIRSAQESMKKAATKEAGSMDKIMGGISSKMVKYPDYFAQLGLTPEAVAGAENIEALKKVAGEKAKELLQGIKPEVLKALTKPLSKENPEDAQKRLDLAKSIPEWAVGDDLETQYKEWVEKGGQESFGKWVSEIREIPEDEKGLWGMFNRPWLKQLIHQLGKLFSKIGGLWEQATTGKKPDPEKNRQKSEFEKEAEKDLQVLKDKKETLDNIKELKEIVKADKENIKIKDFTERADKLTLEESRQLKEILKEKGRGTVQGLALKKDYSIDTLLLIDSKAKEGVLKLEAGQLYILVNNKKVEPVLDWGNETLLKKRLQEETIDWNSLKLSDDTKETFSAGGLEVAMGDGSSSDDDDFNDILDRLKSTDVEKLTDNEKLLKKYLQNTSVQSFLKSIKTTDLAGEIGNNDGLHFGNSGELPLSLLAVIADNNIDTKLSKNNSKREIMSPSTWWTGDLMATVGDKKKDFDTFEELEKWLKAEVVDNK